MSASIKDVAAMAEVSPATVSRTLAGGRVSAALRAKVEAAVEATGYRPNLSARRLRSQDSQTLGLIVADISNPFFTGLARAVEDCAYKAGLRVILCNTDENPDKEAIYLQLMEEERVSGLIFAPTREMVGKLKNHQFNFPIVLVDRADNMNAHDAVVLDNYTAAVTLVEHLYDQGYRQIAGLFGNASTTGIERRAGYEDAMRRLKLTPHARFLRPSTDEAEKEVSGWFNAPSNIKRPDAVIASNGLFLMGVIRALRAAHKITPQDLAIAGFDNERWTELAGPGLTVIEQPVAEMGQTAMQLLLGRLNDPHAAQRKIILGGRCIIRGSTAKQIPV